MFDKIIYVVIVGILGALIMTVFSYPTMYLWNLLMPDIFGLPTITFWQALGLMVLSTLLFWRNL
jgi:hypothetical protein